MTFGDKLHTNAAEFHAVSDAPLVVTMPKPFMDQFKKNPAQASLAAYHQTWDNSSERTGPLGRAGQRVAADTETGGALRDMLLKVLPPSQLAHEETFLSIEHFSSQQKNKDKTNNNKTKKGDVLPLS